MSQSRIHDLMLLLGGLVAVPACTDRDPTDPNDPNGDTAGVDPQQRDQLDDAVEMCKPFGRKYAECYAGEGPGYVSMVGYCIASVGYAIAESPACGDAYSEYFACLAAMDCEDVFGDDAEPGDDELDEDDGADDESSEPCLAEVEALESACDFGEVVEGSDAPPDGD